MYVSVGFHDSATNAFKTTGYTYFTTLPLNVGDIVTAPVKNRKTGEVDGKKAMVLAVGLDEPKFPCSEITTMWTEEENNG